MVIIVVSLPCAAYHRGSLPAVYYKLFSLAMVSSLTITYIVLFLFHIKSQRKNKINFVPLLLIFLCVNSSLREIFFFT